MLNDEAAWYYLQSSHRRIVPSILTLGEMRSALWSLHVHVTASSFLCEWPAVLWFSLQRLWWETFSCLVAVKKMNSVLTWSSEPQHEVKRNKFWTSKEIQHLMAELIENIHALWCLYWRKTQLCVDVFVVWCIYILRSNLKLAFWRNLDFHISFQVYLHVNAESVGERPDSGFHL